MKILLIAPTPFFSDRGCHVRIYEIARGFEELGHRVLILTYGTGRNVGLRVKRVPVRVENIPGPSLKRLIADFLMIFYAPWISFRWRPDLVFSFLHEGIIPGKLASFISGKKLLSDLQGSLPGELSQYGVKFCGFFRWVEKILLLMPDVVTVNTRYLAEKLGIKKYALLPDFLPSIEPVEVKKEKNRGVYVGVLGPHQGTELMLEALSRVKREFRVDIIGYPGEEKYRRMAQRMGLGEKVSFLGRVEYHRLPFYLSRASFALAPKVSESEGNGKMLLYAKFRLPIIAWDTPVNREILEDGFIPVPPGDIEAFSRAVEKAVDGEFKNYGDRAFKNAKNFLACFYLNELLKGFPI